MFKLEVAVYELDEVIVKKSANREELVAEYKSICESYSVIAAVLSDEKGTNLNESLSRTRWKNN